MEPNQKLRVLPALVYRGHPLPNDRPVIPGSPDYYRAKAAALLKQAEVAASEEARVSFLNLAAYWHRLAEQAENPSW